MTMLQRLSSAPCFAFAKSVTPFSSSPRPPCSSKAMQRATTPLASLSAPAAFLALLLVVAAGAPSASGAAVPCPTVTFDNGRIGSSCTAAQICTTCVQEISSQLVPQVQAAVAASPQLLQMSAVRAAGRGHITSPWHQRCITAAHCCCVRGSTTSPSLRITIADGASELRHARLRLAPVRRDRCVCLCDEPPLLRASAAHGPRASASAVAAPWLLVSLPRALPMQPGP